MIAKISSKNSKKYVVINPDGKEYKIKNLIKFCKDHNLLSSLMSRVASGKSSHHKQWTCRSASVSYEEWLEKIQKLKKPNGNNKKWIITNPNNEEFIIDNLTKFCELNNLNYCNMAHVANGIQIHHKQWLCRSAELDINEWLNLFPQTMRVWNVINPNGCKTIVGNLKNFCIKNSLRYTNLISVAEGHQSHHKQWKCETMNISLKEFYNLSLHIC